MSQHAFSPMSQRLRATGTVLDSLVAARRTRLPELYEAYGDIDPLTLPRSERSFEDALRTRTSGENGIESRATGPAIIMECKSASPTLGTIIEGTYSPRLLARAYAPYAAAISVLTEPDRFNGRFEDIDEVRAEATQPVLCKDFVIDPIQITAARVHGADAILLMLSVLDDEAYRELSLAALRLGMDVLTEVDTEDDMRRAQLLGARIIGINNRDLRTLTIDKARTRALAPLAPAGAVVVGESGVSSRSDVDDLAPYVDALLVGSHLSGSDDPAHAAWEITDGVPSAGQAYYEAQARSTSWEPYSSERLGAGEGAATASGEHPTKLSPYFGEFGGQYVPELLIPALDQLEEAFIEAIDDPSFTSLAAPLRSRNCVTSPAEQHGSSSSEKTSSTAAHTRATRSSARHCLPSAWERHASSPRQVLASTAPQPQWSAHSSAWNARSTWARLTLFDKHPTLNAWNSWAPPSSRSLPAAAPSRTPSTRPCATGQRLLRPPTISWEPRPARTPSPRSFANSTALFPPRRVHRCSP